MGWFEATQQCHQEQPGKIHEKQSKTKQASFWQGARRQPKHLNLQGQDSEEQEKPWDEHHIWFLPLGKFANHTTHLKNKMRLPVVCGSYAGGDGWWVQDHWGNQKWSCQHPRERELQGGKLCVVSGVSLWSSRWLLTSVFQFCFSHSFVSSLRFCKMHFVYIYPSLSTFQCSSFLSIQICIFFLKKKKKLSSTDCVAHILLDVWPSLEGGLERATAEKTLALPEAVTSNGCIVKGGTSCPPPHCMLRFCLAWAGTGLLPAASIAVSPFVQLSCYIQKTLFPFSHLPPSAFTIFLSPRHPKY